MDRVHADVKTAERIKESNDARAKKGGGGGGGQGDGHDQRAVVRQGKGGSAHCPAVVAVSLRASRSSLDKNRPPGPRRRCMACLWRLSCMYERLRGV